MVCTCVNDFHVRYNFTVLCKTATSNGQFQSLWRTWTHDSEFLILYLKLNAVPLIVFPENSSGIFYVFNEWE